MNATKTLNVVIAQTYGNNLREVETILEGVEGLEVWYTSNPNQAFAEASNPEAIVLISGQLFYADGREDTEVLGMLSRELSEGKFFQGEFFNLSKEALQKYGDLKNGNNLAMASRKVNPNIITLRFSSSPERNNGFCGDINKLFFGVQGIFELLSNKSFREALESKKLESLPQIEGVEWYQDQFPEGWS